MGRSQGTIWHARYVGLNGRGKASFRNKITVLDRKMRGMVGGGGGGTVAPASSATVLMPFLQTDTSGSMASPGVQTATNEGRMPQDFNNALAPWFPDRVIKMDKLPIDAN